MSAPEGPSKPVPPMSFPKDTVGIPLKFNIRLVPYSLQGGDLSKPNSSIYLPLPTSGLVDNYHIDFEAPYMGALGGVIGGVGSIVKDYNNGAGSILDAIRSMGGNAGHALMREFGASAVEALGDTIDANDKLGTGIASAYDLYQGNIINPNYAALFKGVQLRTFSMTWKLTSQNREESKIVNDIIYVLKKNSLPKKTGGKGDNFLLNFPSIAYIGLYGPNSKNQDSLDSIFMTFSKSGTFIQNINVNFNGDSPHVAIFKDNNAPVQVTLTIDFIERGIITSDDVGTIAGLA